MTKLHIASLRLALWSCCGIFVFATPAIANDLAPAFVSSEPEATVSEPSVSEPSAFEHIEDYSPLECTGQISYTTDATEIEARLAALTRDFDGAVESLLSSTEITDCSAVTGTLSDTTQNINYLHEAKGVYKVVTLAEPTTANTDDYLYTFDILGVRYIPYDDSSEYVTLDMSNSTMLTAIEGTCITDDISYPFEADCTFAATNEANTELSIGKLYYYF